MDLSKKKIGKFYTVSLDYELSSGKQRLVIKDKRKSEFYISKIIPKKNAKLIYNKFNTVKKVKNFLEKQKPHPMVL